MPDLNLQEIDDTALKAIRTPSLRYFFALLLLAGLIAWGSALWVYQEKAGMGVAGINHPVCWGTYIANYVFWIGIAMSGSFVSGLLYLVRSKWRNAVSRTAEAMTFFGVVVAGTFPLIHLGRDWVAYYVFYYPNARQLWPNYISALVWDFTSILSYMLVSWMFFYLGLIPDLAMARDWAGGKIEVSPLRMKLYRKLSLGWTGAGSQWRHFRRSYLYFALLITPLAISIHSVTAWIFSMALLPGWHSTIYAPYFVAGAVYSGMGIILTLLIPARKILKLENLIKVRDFEQIAKIMIVCALVLGYTYGMEHFIAAYSGDIFERQFHDWIATSTISVMYWLIIFFNVVMPVSLLFRKVRRNLRLLFVISLFVNVGMWLERYWLTTASTRHDFLPHNWGFYSLNWVEVSITVTAFSIFFMGTLIFIKLFPTVAVSDYKEVRAEEAPRPEPVSTGAPLKPIGPDDTGLLGVFATPTGILNALRTARTEGFDKLETYSPFHLKEADIMLDRRKSPVRFWTLAGIILGGGGMIALVLGTETVNSRIVGGKPPISMVPFCVLMFEMAMLFGALFTLGSMIRYAKLGRFKPTKGFDRRFTTNKFGLFIACDESQENRARRIFTDTEAEEIHEIR